MKCVYIHIPFCQHICSYCDFCKVLYQKEWIDKYLDSLKEEINDQFNGEILDTLYIGGGTPSCLKKEELTKLFALIDEFSFHNNYEFTFECNPQDINEELIKYLSDHRVNRLSIGIESFNKENLEFMERCHTFELIKEKMGLCRQYINNINLDLMYAIPNESISVLKKDLDLILKLKPDHISTYSLIYEENTKAFINKYKKVSEDLDALMYETICKKLKNKKYIHYEISNFALKEKMSIHNLNYWNNEEYYGFGLGASGYIHGFRYKNTCNLEKYLTGNRQIEQNILGKDDIMDNEIMLGLRKIEGINIIKFAKKFDDNIQSKYPVQELIEQKLLKYKNNYIFIPEDKIYVSNEIINKLI